MTPKIVMTVLSTTCLVYGLYMFFGALRNWRHFNNASKRIDLIELFGTYGRLLYVIIGFITVILSTLALLAFNNIGPLAAYLSFTNRHWFHWHFLLIPVAVIIIKWRHSFYSLYWRVNSHADKTLSKKLWRFWQIIYMDKNYKTPTVHS